MATSNKQNTNTGKLKRLVKVFNPSSFKGGMALFALVFALGGAGYYLHKSFAATCVDYNYQQGQSGQCVLDIQVMINGSKQGTLLVEDGKFGPATKAAVQTFQSGYPDWGSPIPGTHLTPDGIVGPKTWAGLCDIATMPKIPMSTREKKAYYAGLLAGCKVG